MPNRVPSVWLVLALCLGLVHLNSVASYSQIALSGSHQNGEGPKIFKAMNVDLIYPNVFNSSERLLPATTQSPTAPSPAPSSAPGSEASAASSPPSNRGPTIFVTPASVDAVEVAATPSPAGLARIVAESLAMPANERQQQRWPQQQPEPLEQQQLEEPQQQQLEQQPFASTGRAVDYRPTYPFGQLITPLINNARPRPRPASAPVVYGARPRPQTQSAPGVGKLVYPSGQRRPPSRPSGKAQDRFSPSEAVVSHHYKHNNKKHQHEHKLPAASNQVASYVPPKDLYSFPPNLDAKYPSPAEDPNAAVPTSSVSSYLPPPSGPLTNAGDYPLAANSDGYHYAGPVSPDLMPADGGGDGDGGAKMPGDDGADSDPDDGDDSIGVLPASAMDGGDMGGADDGGMAGMDMGGDDHHHDHPLTGYDTDKEYPTPPPGWLEEHPETAHAPPHHGHDHDHGYDDHHDHFPSFPVFRQPHPEVIYDDHFHHHHPEPHHMPPPETTVAPPPEPRVKKYSYFYIGRKLWYIPLYFTVWFSFYVLWLIVKSIARHKVNLPNHYVSRRSVPEYSTERTNDHIDQLTVSVLDQIETFRKKYHHK